MHLGDDRPWSESILRTSARRMARERSANRHACQWPAASTSHGCNGGAVIWDTVQPVKLGVRTIGAALPVVVPVGGRSTPVLGPAPPVAPVVTGSITAGPLTVKMDDADSGPGG